jgi:translation elongation factor EF-4
MGKIVYVLNKVDLVNPEDAMEKCNQLGIFNESNNNFVMISSKTGLNVNVLLNTICSKIFVDKVKVDNT